ncbi:MAG: hypothetical protein JW914_04440 [Syntrophaceae bacterium]|nr:hypothetical protein [Syntrophaceae bacterium]
MSDRKRNIILTAITLIIVLASYYLLRISGDTAVRDDLVDYINNKVTKAHQSELRAMDDYDSVNKEQHIDKEALLEKLTSDIIPTYKSFIEELKGIKPKTRKVEKINELYIDAANAQYDAFTSMSDALKNKDEKTLTAAMSKLDENRQLFMKMRSRLARLAVRENIKIEISDKK